MSNIHKLHSHERLYGEASEWVAKLDRGLTKKEDVELQEWLCKSQENRELFLKMAEILDKTDTLAELANLFPQPITHKPKSPWSIAIAASVSIIALSLIFSTASNIWFDNEEQQGIVNAQNLYKTGVGEHSNIKLPDGTEVTLNTNSTVKVNYTDNHRLILLEHGEIYVDVAHDKNRPFSVAVGNQIIQAVGTEFNIELHSEQHIELVVTEGKVLVAVHDAAPSKAQNSQAIRLPSTSRSVSEGQRLELGTDDERTTSIEPSEIALKLSWREGNLIFRGDSLEEAIDEIGRYTTVEFVFLDDSLKKVRIVGLFKAGDVNGLLTALKENFNISYRRENQKVFLGGNE